MEELGKQKYVNEEILSVKFPSQATPIEKEFFSSLTRYYEKIKINCKESKSVPKICNNLYEKDTVPFLNRWHEHFSFLQPSPTYSGWPYYSFELHLPDKVVLIPHRAVVYEFINPDNVIKTKISNLRNISEFVQLFNRFYTNISVNLNLNDLKIIKGLTSKRFLQSSSRFPTNEKMAKLCGCTRQTFTRRFDVLTTGLSVIYLNCRIDVGRLGYETFNSILPLNQFEKVREECEKYCLAVIPINTFSNISHTESYYLIISQIPIHRNDSYSILSNGAHGSFHQRLSQAYIGWNLKTIHPDSNLRWKVLPPILSTQTWTDHIISENNGIFYDLNPQEYNPSLTSSEIKLLSYFEKYGFVQDKKLATTLGLSLKTIQNTWRRLSQRKLFHRFSFISNIGLDFKPWITIIGKQESHSPQLIENIVEHLKFFPFCFLFFETGNRENSHPIITGVLHMPPAWVDDFFFKISLLSELQFDVNVNFAHNRIIKQNINLEETYNKK